MTGRIVTLQPEARDFLRSKLERSGDEAVVLLLKSGGCAGHSYEWRPMTATEARNFAGGDYGIEDLGGGRIFAVDSMSEIMLLGSVVSVRDDFAGLALEVTSPQAKSSCGCGTSVNFGAP